MRTCGALSLKISKGGESGTARGAIEPNSGLLHLHGFSAVRTGESLPNSGVRHRETFRALGTLEKDVRHCCGLSLRLSTVPRAKPRMDCLIPEVHCRNSQSPPCSRGIGQRTAFSIFVSCLRWQHQRAAGLPDLQDCWSGRLQDCRSARLRLSRILDTG